MTPPQSEPDIARAAALIAEPSRARILKALADGRAASSGALAAEAGVSASTASEHLARLAEAGLITTERRGRRREHRLAGPDVGAALEALAVIAPPEPGRTLRQSSRARALSRSRTCYDHLAGRLGVDVLQAMLQRGLIVGHDGFHRPGKAVRDRPSSYGRDIDYRVSDAGRAWFARFGVDVAALPPRRPLVRYCVDWTEQRHHLSGALGATLLDRLFALGWLRRGASPRVVHVTDAGVTGLAETLGVGPR
ncbi:HTH-type transcriptional regulator CmtR [Actinomadura rubteroloni]|uniref:HTH-type transcriptional regulator CmtR n=1 Tax=Actinomadura rubteroloni TaxID=1926885 RepID=A0A2P4UQB7_9ACTN|nr:helix-turn-helix domain-containing protein [Actinomadura rubteroloni]POM27219.1 HTH-type transcriptional regulator CmtR [Actinomadura rubteroloni]